MHERFRLLPSVSLHPLSPEVLSEVLSRVRQPEIYMCVCPALKRYPRKTGTRDPDPVRLLRKLRDRKGLFYVETQLRGTLLAHEKFIAFLLTRSEII